MAQSSIDWRVLEDTRKRDAFRLTDIKELTADYGSVALERLVVGPGIVANVSEIKAKRPFQLTTDIREQGDCLCLQSTLAGHYALDVEDGVNARYQAGTSTAHGLPGTVATFSFQANSALRMITYTLSRDELDNRLTGVVPHRFQHLLEDEGLRTGQVRRQNPAALQYLGASLFQEKLTGSLRALQVDGMARVLLAHLLDDPGAENIANTTPVPPRVRNAVHDIRDRIVSDPLNLPDLETLARDTGIDRKTLNQAFKTLFGSTIFGFAKAQRLDSARLSLLDGSRVLKEIAHEAGYAHVSNFVTAYKKRFGTTPGSDTQGAG
ncbi:AraC family transcriptional regulator [Roseibium aggregatum]|uniref:Helix-turn-helix transcriptional regulator n=1 Tax=Roseibium aggregatum TaxID=187304 RepID=A0A939E9X3_9HYPH|nr:AraC family transcriptional regulator [Roseibium aggregatum]MBN9669033.1 helix-turn-helix transcriptional regulator [Roseibium aggregatum]